MGQAARAIIIEDNKVLVMQRIKQGSQYFTLVGGRVGEGESVEQALRREIKEETGLQITAERLVYIEEHPAPYNDQYIYLCEVAPHDNIAIQDTSEEALLNRTHTNIHQPSWAQISSFKNLPFRTPQLQEALVRAFKKGFPKTPVKL